MGGDTTGGVTGRIASAGVLAAALPVESPSGLHMHAACISKLLHTAGYIYIYICVRALCTMLPFLCWGSLHHPGLHRCHPCGLQAQ